MDAEALATMRATGLSPDGRVYTETVGPDGERVSWELGYTDEQQMAVTAAHQAAAAAEVAERVEEQEKFRVLASLSAEDLKALAKLVRRGK